MVTHWRSPSPGSPKGSSPRPPTGFTYVGEWEVVDESGRFVAAAGSGHFDGFGDIPGDLVIDFTGTIAYDASDGAK
jgi:hypothetical protein